MQNANLKPSRQLGNQGGGIIDNLQAALTTNNMHGMVLKNDPPSKNITSWEP
jgi:hypothetical protein